MSEASSGSSSSPPMQWVRQPYSTRRPQSARRSRTSARRSSERAGRADSAGTSADVWHSARRRPLDGGQRDEIGPLEASRPPFQPAPDDFIATTANVL